MFVSEKRNSWKFVPYQELSGLSMRDLCFPWNPDMKEIICDTIVLSSVVASINKIRNTEKFLLSWDRVRYQSALRD